MGSSVTFTNKSHQLWWRVCKLQVRSAHSVTFGRDRRSLLANRIVGFGHSALDSRLLSCISTVKNVTTHKPKRQQCYCISNDSDSGDDGNRAGGNGGRKDRPKLYGGGDNWFDEWSGAALVFACFAAFGWGCYYFVFRKKGGVARRHEVSLLRDHIERLKRLQKETYAELVAVRTRLDKLEGESPTDRERDPFSVFNEGLASTATKAKLKLQAVLELGATVCFSKAAAAAALFCGSGAPGGAVVRVRGCHRDVEGQHEIDVVAHNNTQATNFQIAQVLYRIHVTPWLTLHVCPVGCTAGDIAPTLNPCDGWGLCDIVRKGYCWHNDREGGAGVGATATGQDHKLTAAHVRNGGVASTLLQLTPTTSSSSFSWAILAAQHTTTHNTHPAGISQLPQLLLNRHTGKSSTASPAPPDEQLPTTITDTTTTPHSSHSSPKVNGDDSTGPRDGAGSGNFGTEENGIGGSDPDVSRGKVKSRAFHGAALGVLNIEDEFALSGWFAPQGWHPRGWGWGLTLSAFPDYDGSSWALSAGQTRNDVLDVSQGRPFVMEMSVRYCVGDGMFLTPGVVYVRDEEVSALGLAVKSEWLF